MQNQTRNLVMIALVATLFVVTCWKHSPGQGEADKPEGVKWEYVVDLKQPKFMDHPEGLRDYLNDRTKGGWVYCDCVTHGQSCQFVFKRQVSK